MNKDLLKICAEVNKQYGCEAILPASQAMGLVVDRLPSSIFDLDVKIGGGFPRGRISVIKGDFSTGKSAICLKTAATSQQICRLCGDRFEYTDLLGEVHKRKCTCGSNVPMNVVWMDSENNFDPSWAKKWGMNIDQSLIIQTEYAEQGIDVADKCIRSGKCDLLVVDSVAALTPGVEVEESSEKWQVGVLARLMGKACRKWTSGMNSHGLKTLTKTTILVVNQLRTGIGGFHAYETSPGGRALNFFESLELRLKRESYIEDSVSGRPKGIRVSYVPKKNKTAPINGGGEFALYFVCDPGRYSTGDTDTDLQALRLSVYWDLEYVKKNGAWYTFADGTKVQGEVAAADRLRTNPEILLKLMEEVEARELSWRETGVKEQDETT